MGNALLIFRSLGQGISDSIDPNLAYSHKILSQLLPIADVTVLVTGTNEVGTYRNQVNLFFDHHIRVISYAEIANQTIKPKIGRLRDYRPFIDRSTHIYEYVEPVDYDVIVFDVFDAPGFIPIRAKRTGLGLAGTYLVSWLRNCHGFSGNQQLHPPGDFDPFMIKEQIAFAERYCCENSDLVVAHTEGILKWGIQQGWKLDTPRVARLSNLKAGVPLWTAPTETILNDAVKSEDLTPTNNNPLVSICVAHYNDGRNLGYLLDSIEQNDYANFEVIVVDDGSTDIESLTMVKSLAAKYGSSSWQFVFKDQNNGPGPTRNLAATLANAEFIIFVDSDDIAARTMISDFVKGMLTSKVDCLSCSSVRFKDDCSFPEESSFIELFMPLGGCIELAFYPFFFGGTYFCVRKTAFEALGGFSDILGIQEDWDFLARLVLAGFTFDVFPKAIFFYRIRSGSRHVLTVSSNAMQILRQRLVKIAGPKHENLVHELLLDEISENERLRSSVWKLDRKVVQVALKLSLFLSEKNRLMLQNMTAGVFGNLKAVVSKACQMLKEVKPESSTTRETLGSHGASAQNCAKNTNVADRELTHGELQDALRRFSLPFDKPIFGFMGKLSEDSRPLAFLKLAYWAQMSLDNSFFVMVGDGPWRNQVTSSAAAFGLQNFKLIADLDNISELYPLLSGLVVTSRSDPDRREILEALTYGIPVLSTLCGPATETLGTQGNWLVVKHEPEHKEFSHCFKNWKDNLEIYQTAAKETAELARRKRQTQRQ